MLVDLARNDVGRVVEFGTEQVDEMMTLERYSHVMHLTSQVSGTLRDGLGPIDVLRATLPAGTVSGAPKVRAMEIIDDARAGQARARTPGVVGYIDFSGNLDTAIAIRTMVVQPDGRASVQAGAGIVADSVPEHEDLECRNKAQALLAAVPAARRMTAARARRGAQPRTRMRAPFCGVDRARRRARRSGPDTVGVPAGPAQPGRRVAGGRRVGVVVAAAAAGKVDAWLRVTRDADDEFVLDVDGGWGDALVERLARFKLRTKCDLDRVDGWRASPCATCRWRRATGAGLPIVWPGTDGYDLLGPDVEPPDGIAARRRTTCTSAGASKPVCRRSGTS